MSKSHSKAVLVINIMTKTKRIFPSIKETANYFNISSTKIHAQAIHINKKNIMFDLYLIT